MEVHHHAHTARKKWTHYFWEFLMLFLAVFCGFLAENIREHKVEQHRARDYARSLIQDLQQDTAAISVEIKSAKLYIGVVDSLLNLEKKVLEGRTAAQFCFYTRFTYWTVPVYWNRNTFEQIKNSGSLRYFKNAELLKNMMRYDAKVNEIRGEAEANSNRGYHLLPLISSLIEPGLHFELSKHILISLDTMTTRTQELFLSYPAGSLENKRALVQQFLNQAIVQQRNLRFMINTRWSDAHRMATELIGELKKEYHLK